MTAASSTNTDPVIERHDAFMSPNYPRYAVVMARGEGCRVWDSEGNEYLDLFAGFGGVCLLWALVSALMLGSTVAWLC